MKVLVISDTHTHGTTRALPEGAWPFIETADHILHSGDVVDPALLDELKTFAPVDVVMGNCDGWDVRDWGATETKVVDLAGIEIGMIHDSGTTIGRRERMRKRFPTARVVVFGHSHMPVNEDDGDLLLLNPGSPTWKRRAAYNSMALLWIEDGEVAAEVFAV
ncbi:MAG: YfcE family phosphodiesterase [Actinobacteria bacterium]|nr:YfcE family phosphodiesterase [Actinomycetota bacterium]